MINFKTLIATLALVYVSGTASAAYLAQNKEVQNTGGSYESIYNDESKSDYGDKKKASETKKEKYGY